MFDMADHWALRSVDAEHRKWHQPTVQPLRHAHMARASKAAIEAIASGHLGELERRPGLPPKMRVLGNEDGTGIAVIVDFRTDAERAAWS